MGVAGTERTLTVDANVALYHMQFVGGHRLSRGLRVRRMGEFACRVLEECSIALNDHIKLEYDETLGVEYSNNWLAKRAQSGLVVIVPCCDLGRGVKRRLRVDYRFGGSRDRRYVETCANTIMKHLVTENERHFGGPIVGFLERELGMVVCGVDECCGLV